MLPLRLSAAILFTLCFSATACAQQPAPAASEPQPVWVNYSSGVYHCSGTEHYGTTKKGKYLPEASAIRQGFRANGGHFCNPSESAVFDSLLAVRAIPPPSLADSGPPLPRVGKLRCVVTRIVDGDTIHCADFGSVRLIGIDSPERDQDPYGSMATKGLMALLAVGDTIALTGGPESQDQHKRLLAYAWSGAGSINWLMIRRGWAVTLEVQPNTQYADWFRQAETRAEEAKAGLWAIDGFQCRPSKHRAGLC